MMLKILRNLSDNIEREKVYLSDHLGDLLRPASANICIVKIIFVLIQI